MLNELIYVVNFDDTGAFIQRAEGSVDVQQHGSDSHHDSDKSVLGSSLGSSNNSSSSSSSAAAAPSSAEAALDPMCSPPSFESFLAVPRDFMAHHAMRSATEASLLLDIAATAIEMDAITACTCEQLHDRQQLLRTLANAEMRHNPHSGASLATTLLVLLRQATASNSETMATLLNRMQACMDRLGTIRYPLAACVENNMAIANETTNDQQQPSTGASRCLLAQVEEDLLQRIASVVDAYPTVAMAPLIVPKWKPSASGYGLSSTTPVCWPTTSSHSTSGSPQSQSQSQSQQRHRDDQLQLSASHSSSSSSTTCSSNSNDRNDNSNAAFASSASSSSSMTQCASDRATTTPTRSVAVAIASVPSQSDTIPSSSSGPPERRPLS